MSQSLVRHLIVKDIQLHRTTIVIAFIGGVIGLAVLQLKGIAGLLGIIGFFTALIVLGSMIPNASILNERKGHNLAFLMSLPISMVEYTTAKVLAALGMFMVPWLVLLVIGLSLIFGRTDIPHGIIPLRGRVGAAARVGGGGMIGGGVVGEWGGWVGGGTVVGGGGGG